MIISFSGERVEEAAASPDLPTACSIGASPPRRRDRIVEQSLTRGCCDDPCSQEAARTCLCSTPALFLIGPSDGVDASVQEPRYQVFFPRPGSVQGPLDIRNFLAVVGNFVQRPRQVYHPLLRGVLYRWQGSSGVRANRD